MKSYEFEAVVQLDPLVADGYMRHHVVLPPAVFKALREAGVRRVTGKLGDVSFQRALQTRTDGTPCLKFGKGWLRDAGLAVGAEAHVTLTAQLDPNEVEVPDELVEALSGAPDVALAFEALTPGKRRTLIYPVTRAKRPATRHKRAAAVVEQVRELMEDMQW